MRIAILGDVHGNAYALDAVLRDVRAQSPDVTYNLGDTVWGAADPARAWALQQEFAPPTVRGNTDETLAGRGDKSPEYRAWVLEQVGQAVADAVGALPLTACLHGGELLLTHGRPRSAWEPLLLTEDSDWDRSRTRAATTAELEHRVNDWPGARVVVAGHTHLELIRHWRGVTYVNAGAVSRQKDHDPRARWLLLDRDPDSTGGGWNVQFRRVNYDVAAAAAWAQAHSPKGEQEARQLLTGRS